MGQNIVKNFFVRLLATIGALVLLAAIVGGAAFAIAKRAIPPKVILEVNLEQRLVEYVPDDPVARIVSGRVPTMLNLIEALQRAATDHRVVGLIARVGEAGLPLADVQEIRDAVIAFRHTGKPAIAYAETFGEGGKANGSYYLATAFDKIYLQPSGELGLAGLMTETPFLRGTLDKLGFVPRMDHRAEYKNAMNELTETKYTPAHKEATEKIVDSAFGQLVAGIAEARKMSTNDVRALINRGPFLADEALKAKLVDKLAYRDAAYDDIKKQVGPHAKFLYASKYLDRAGSPYDEGDTVALIYGVGDIHRGKSGYNAIFQNVSMGADTVAAAFRAAADDKSVKAILFRIDSGGGSYVASDTIWREVVRAKKAGKPIIVSMGAVADPAAISSHCPPIRLSPSPPRSRRPSACSREKCSPRISGTNSASLGTRSTPVRTPRCSPACRITHPNNGSGLKVGSTASTTISPPRSPTAANFPKTKSSKLPKAASGPARTPRRSVWWMNSADFPWPCVSSARPQNYPPTRRSN